MLRHPNKFIFQAVIKIIVAHQFLFFTFREKVKDVGIALCQLWGLKFELLLFADCISF
jgi:hypothetical protein